MVLYVIVDLIVISFFYLRAYAFRFLKFQFSITGSFYFSLLFDLSMDL